MSSTRHYDDTVVRTVPLDLIGKYVSPGELSQLKEIYPDGECRVWGVTPGVEGSNRKKWDRISVGDTTLFSGNGKIFASGVTTYKLHNYGLALKLWKKDPNGQTWEYIYFIDEVKDQAISYPIFNTVVGYDRAYIIQGFNVLDESKSLKLFNTFNLLSDIYLPVVDGAKLEDAISYLDNFESTDAIVQSKRRLEQAYFRKHLFGRKTVEKCGICDQEYPINLLVTAHIKKRSKCTHQEKIDVNVVMPMCKFGCDDLFENEYIAVINGEIVDMKKQPITTNVSRVIGQLAGKSCRYFTPASQKYFDWHSGVNRIESKLSE